MAKQQYKGSLSLEWYNKNKSIIMRDENAPAGKDDIPAPKINWINKDQALFYEIDESEGRGIKPYWVDRNDIRVKETRPLVFQKAYKAEPKEADLTGQPTGYDLIELDEDDPTIENILIRGDNLLALNTLKKIINQKSEEEKVKCIYIDPPFNTGASFENYDDNLAHSEWLTMMRDRLLILHSILRNDGFICIHLDDVESAYCRVLLDEVFGRHNYCNEIIFSTNASFGFKSTADAVFKQANHLLFYAKNKQICEITKLFKEKHYDTAYNKVFENIDKPEDEWTWRGINEVVAENLGFVSSREATNKVGEEEFDNQVALFALNNAERVFRTASVTGGALKKRQDTIQKSRDIPDKIIRHPNDDMDYQFIRGERVLYYRERLVEIDGEILPGEAITDIWDDIPTEGLATEGGVDFPRGKKPERLMQRLFEITTKEGDVVLDCFSGSGSTIAVAQKLKRNWVSVEIGGQADTHIIPRLKSVISGQDQSGISRSINWQGGGSFKYYHLGPSIIEIGEDGKGDFNWQLGRQFIEESLLSSYDYVLDNEMELPATELFGENYKPKVGTLQVGTKVMAAVCSLNEPEGQREMMSIDEIEALYKTLKKRYSPEFITIFTNRGVEIALDSKPEDLEIIKVPHAIFAELEK